MCEKSLNWNIPTTFPSSDPRNVAFQAQADKIRPRREKTHKSNGNHVWNRFKGLSLGFGKLVSFMSPASKLKYNFSDTTTCYEV